jgi:hypothetical protein
LFNHSLVVLKGTKLDEESQNAIARMVPHPSYAQSEEECYMSEKRMLIVDAELVKKIDDNRGDLCHSEFIDFLIDNQLKEESKKHDGVTREEFRQFQEGTKELLRNFLEFFISYGLELGKQPKDKEFEQLSQRLQALGSSQIGKSG